MLQCADANSPTAKLALITGCTNHWNQDFDLISRFELMELPGLRGLLEQVIPLRDN